MISAIKHDYEDLIRLFNHCFQTDYQTQLIKGEEEPLYLPKDMDQPYHRIIFAHGFFSSALHEIAHWLIAGPSRRMQIDYGYWYIPEGRTREQQLLFEHVEVKPQALEWILSEVAGHQFHFSFDHLNGSIGDEALFKAAVSRQAAEYRARRLWARAERFRSELISFYQTV